MVKIGLVQINNNYSGQSYLPYSIGLLHAYVQAYAKDPEKYEFLVPVHLRIPVEEAVNKLLGADVVGISSYVWNIRISLEVARHIKERKPDTVIVFGGPQVPNHAESFLKKHSFIDLAVHGEGEPAFLEILERLENRNWDSVPSVSFLKKDSYIRNPNGPRMTPHDEKISPYLNNVFTPLIQANPHEHWLAIWETNRGCPFSCTYCDWGSATQSKVNKFELSRLYKEIDWFADKKIEFVFCADANFGMFDRDYDIAVRMAESKQKCGYPRTVSVQNTKNATEKAYKVQKLLADSHLNTAITISFQSTNMQTLENIRRANISLKSFQELQRRFTVDRIPTYTDIIIGLPGETYETYADGVSSVIEGGQHNRIFFMNLSILPNAEMGDPEYQKKFGMITVQNEVVYIRGSIHQAQDEFAELQELVIATNTLSKEDWVRARSFAWVCNFLHFNKLLQIPFILLNKIFSCSYRELVELFSEADHSDFPVLTEAKQFFNDKARAIQNGDHEFCPSKEWLGVYWPVDEYLLIKFSSENKLSVFYSEAERRLCLFLADKGISLPNNILHDAIKLNSNLIKQPFFDTDIEVSTSYNIWEFYQAVLNGISIPLEEKRCVYKIDRISKKWSSWDVWCREVVWYSSKSGAFLYTINDAMEREKQFKLAGHH